MKEVLKKESNTEKGNKQRRMGKFTMVNGRIIKEKERELVFM
jgi:hypothetical protein